MKKLIFLLLIFIFPMNVLALESYIVMDLDRFTVVFERKINKQLKPVIIEDKNKLSDNEQKILKLIQVNPEITRSELIIA